MLTKPLQISPRILWSAVTAVAVLLSATAVMTWEIRRDYVDELKRQIETYEKSTTWKLPDTLNEIKAASDALKIQARERQELEQLRKESASTKAEQQRLEADLKSTRERLAEGKATLDRLVAKGRTLDLARNETAALIENNVFLGLRSVYSDSVAITLENQSKYLNVGESISYSFGGKRCTVTLMKIASDRATFSHGCV